MKNRVLKILAIILSVAFAIQSSLSSALAALSIAPGATVAVSVINNTGDRRYRNIGSQIEDRAIQSLLRRGYRVVERAMLERIMREKQIIIVFDDNKGQTELGGFAGADYMMVIRVDEPQVKRRIFREGGRQYEKLDNLKVSISIKVLSVADSSVADMSTLSGSRSGLSDKTDNDLPQETVKAAASEIEKYITPVNGQPDGIPTWGWVAIGGAAVVGVVAYASVVEPKGKCLEEVCLKEECSDYDASGECIKWKCAKTECLEYEEKEEKSSAAPSLHHATLKSYLHQANKTSQRFQISRNFEIKIYLLKWRF